MAKLKLRTLNDIILDLQDICNIVGNYPVVAFGASSNGKFLVELLINEGEYKEYYFDQFDQD